MRRKIPGRKHRGVRDPEQQNAQRLEKIKNKINNPPANIDEQQLPKSVERLRILRDRIKNGEFKKRKKRQRKTQIFPQLPNENHQQYEQRITKLCDDIHREAEFEKKYGVSVKRNECGEVVDVVKRDKNPFELMVEKARKDKKSKQQQNADEKLTKSQKKQLKLKEKKQQKLLVEQGDTIESKLIDTVRFGEQVHAPPVLTIPKKAKKQQMDDATTRKPGQKNLLLKTILVPSKQVETKSKAVKIDRKGKRRDLPNSVRRQLDKQQKEVIEAYKAIKSKKKQEFESMK